MRWDIWRERLLFEFVRAIIPVVTASVVAIQDNPRAPVWAVMIAAASLIGIRQFASWWKHKDWPIAPQE